MTEPMAGLVTHLEAAIDGTQLPADRLQTMHKDRPLWVRYDLDAISQAVDPGTLAGREPTMWRYRELLPVPMGSTPTTEDAGGKAVTAARRIPSPQPSPWKGEGAAASGTGAAGGTPRIPSPRPSPWKGEGVAADGTPPPVARTTCVPAGSGKAWHPAAGSTGQAGGAVSLPVTLGEQITPLLPAPRLGESLGLTNLWIKDESRLPTGSFKSRGLAMAVSMACHFGIRRLAIPTAGNAGGAMAAYAARAGLEAWVFMPADTPIANQFECAAAGAKVFLVSGLIGDCARIVRGGMEAMGWFDCSTLKEPYRIEGKKTMGLELAEQLEWRLPDVILYPTGGGTGLIGMWKAFQELRTLGWLRSEKMPRMIAVQSDGCAPIPRAFEAGERFARPWQNARTCASGLRVPGAVGDFMILDAIRASGGCAVAVAESRIVEAMRRATALEGIAVCPESAACVLAAEKLVADGRIGGDERVVLFNTGTSAKYVETMPLDLPRIEDPNAVDYEGLV